MEPWMERLGPVGRGGKGLWLARLLGAGSGA